MASTGSSGVARWVRYPLRSTAPAAAWVIEGACTKPPLSLAGSCTGRSAAQSCSGINRLRLSSSRVTAVASAPDTAAPEAAGRTFSTQPYPPRRRVGAPSPGCAARCLARIELAIADTHTSIRWLHASSVSVSSRSSSAVCSVARVSRLARSWGGLAGGGGAQLGEPGERRLGRRVEVVQVLAPGDGGAGRRRPGEDVPRGDVHRGLPDVDQLCL